jgi:hypothetical protein
VKRIEDRCIRNHAGFTRRQLGKMGGGWLGTCNVEVAPVVAVGDAEEIPFPGFGSSAL